MTTAMSSKTPSRRSRTKVSLDRYFCHDCAARPPRGDYMVHAAIWQRAGMPRRGFLCLTCLDDRLVAAGHGHLKLTDFTATPCNAALRFGYDLALHDRNNTSEGLAATSTNKEHRCG